MDYETAKCRCHVRSAIFRRAFPEKKFAKNHYQSFDIRVPIEWQKADDWEEYDPNDFYNISLGADSY